jgi:hypothetical protein
MVGPVSLNRWNRVFQFFSGLELFNCLTRLMIPNQFVELHLQAGRTPFDVNSVYFKTGKRFRVVLKYRTDCT